MTTNYERRSVTLHPLIYKKLQAIRASVIKEGEEISFTTILNMILCGGIIGAKRFTEEDWKYITNFFLVENKELNLESLKDQYADHMLDKLSKRGVVKK